MKKHVGDRSFPLLLFCLFLIEQSAQTACRAHCNTSSSCSVLNSTSSFQHPIPSCTTAEEQPHGQCQTCFDEICRPCQTTTCLTTCLSCPGSTSTCLCTGNRLTEPNDCCTQQRPPERCFNRCNQPRSIFIPRSAGSNTARQLVGLQEYIHSWNEGCSYLTAASTLAYTHSFRPERIARYLFGRTELRFSGSQVPNRPACDLLADYFGLSPEFQGAASVSPTIENAIFEQQFYLGLNSICPGLFMRINIPLVHTRWQLGACQAESTPPSSDCPEFPSCYMSCPPSAASCSLPEALSGKFTFGDMQEPWQFGRISFEPQTKTGIAQLDLVVGRDVVQTDRYHVGFFGILSLPTGTKPSPEVLFSPIIGNGKHTELGIGLTAHSIIYADCTQYVDVWILAQATHLFKNRQCRSFDFCRNGPLSRYLLLKQFADENNEISYAHNLITGTSFTTRSINSSVSVKGDVAAKIALHTRNYTFDLGYNFYGRSRETVCLVDQNQNNESLFGIKGTTDVCTPCCELTETVSPRIGAQVSCCPTRTTASNATICSGGTPDHAVDIRLDDQKIPLSSFSRQTGSVEGSDVITAVDSCPPMLVTQDDLDLVSGSAAANATHALFAHVDFAFLSCPRYHSTLGFGGEFEVEALACNEQSSLNQWSIWLKGVLTF